MSYNINRWRVKHIANFRVPMSVFWKDESAYEVTLLGPRSVHVHGPSEVFDIEGELVSTDMNDAELDVLRVTDIEMYGEGSGHAYEFMEEIFKKSAGKLVVSQVWEHGDTVQVVTVIDGAVTVEKVDV